MRTAGAGARGGCVVGAGGGGAAGRAGRGEPGRVGEALGDEGAEGEDDDDSGLGEGGGLEVVEDAELEAGKDDWGVGLVVVGGGGGGGMGVLTWDKHEEAVGDDEDVHRGEALHRGEDAAARVHVHDEAADEEEAEPGDGGGGEPKVSLCDPEGFEGALPAQGVLHLGDGVGDAEGDGDEDEGKGEHGRRDLPEARPQLDHGPGLQKQGCFDENDDGHAEDVARHAVVVVDAVDGIQFAGQEDGHGEPGRGEVVGEEDHADHVEGEGEGVDDGGAALEPAFWRHDEQDDEHDEAGANLAAIVDGSRRGVHKDLVDVGERCRGVEAGGGGQCHGP